MQKTKPAIESLVNYQVRVYWNSQKRLFSVQAPYGGGKWLVIGHVSNIRLLNVQLKVSKAGHKRAIREGVKNVHAYMQGMLIDTRQHAESTMGQTERFEKLHALSYSLSDGCFVVVESMTIWPIEYTSQVWATVVEGKPKVTCLYDPATDSFRHKLAQQ